MSLIKIPTHLVPYAGCPFYLTQGKEYEITKVILRPDSIRSGTYTIICDSGEELITSHKQSAHLNGKNFKAIYKK